jgi:hypothetical protein
LVDTEPVDVVVPDHPRARLRNHYGAPVDIKTHNWVHSNVKFVGTPEQYKDIKSAFSTTTSPWNALGYKPVTVDDATLTISRWTYRDCPVAHRDGHSLWVAFESLHNPPTLFLQHVANTQPVTSVTLSYCPPYKTGEWNKLKFTKE